ncbi:hypothetical protein [Oryzomonas rubra]|uniref:Uncharacterized protein n=1 Tax=Oryzomonas rubra TaxID=2509454 RepID=A0A5A9X619_9BACT|nr:hypothetical protein [Oryzomonas rubra]KAA0888103.1 hypothetical protein ET418_17025 [Oryzomonas rubra]
MKLNKRYISGLADKYELPQARVSETVRGAIETCLMTVTHLDVNVKMADDEVLIYAWRDKGDDGIKHVDIDPSRLGRRFIHYVAQSIKQLLTRDAALEAYGNLAEWKQSIILGTIDRVERDAVTVLTPFPGGYVFIGRCDKNCLLPHDLKELRAGMKRLFYINNISTVDEHGVLRVDIVLNRRSIHLPALVIKYFCREAGIKMPTVRVFKRIAGARSEITIDRRIPVEILKKASDELREAIRIIKPAGRGIQSDQRKPAATDIESVARDGGVQAGVPMGRACGETL